MQSCHRQGISPKLHYYTGKGCTYTNVYRTVYNGECRNRSHRRKVSTCMYNLWMCSSNSSYWVFSLCTIICFTRFLITTFMWIMPIHHFAYVRTKLMLCMECEYYWGPCTGLCNAILIYIVTMLSPCVCWCYSNKSH